MYYKVWCIPSTQKKCYCCHPYYCYYYCYYSIFSNLYQAVSSQAQGL